MTKQLLVTAICLSTILSAAAEARERRERRTGGDSVVVELITAPFGFLRFLTRPAVPCYGNAPYNCAPIRRGRVSDTDYMLYGSGRSR
jgi:hypothetical protein